MQQACPGCCVYRKLDPRIAICFDLGKLVADVLIMPEHSSRRSFFTVCRRRRRIYMGREQFLKSPSSGEPPAGAMPAPRDCATETRLREPAGFKKHTIV